MASCCLHFGGLCFCDGQQITQWTSLPQCNYNNFPCYVLPYLSSFLLPCNTEAMSTRTVCNLIGYYQMSGRTRSVQLKPQSEWHEYVTRLHRCDHTDGGHSEPRISFNPLVLKKHISSQYKLHTFWNNLTKTSIVGSSPPVPTFSSRRLINSLQNAYVTWK
jgi:hypothetical protein